jgi:hypothetical protein
MYRLFGLMLLAILIASCQPQTNIQTSLQTLKTKLPSLSGTSLGETAEDDVERQEAGIVTEDVGHVAAADVIKSAQVVTAKSVATAGKTAESITVEVTALNEDETGEPLVPLLEADGEGATPADHNTLHITNPIQSESKVVVEGESFTILEDAIAETDVAAIQIIDESAQEQVAVTEPPKTPEPIHPQTIVGQSINDLGTHLGPPDFERSDADVVIWQYRLAACVTDFYLYPDGDDYVVTGWAWRPPFVNQAMDEEICQKQIGTLLDTNA